MGNRYELWKKYGLPLPGLGNLIPSRTYMGAEHGTYDDYPLLMEAPWYQDPSLRTPEAIVRRGQSFKIMGRKESILPSGTKRVHLTLEPA